MNTDIKNHMLGLLGEKVVAKYLRDVEHATVIESETIFDWQKDLTADGTHIEVKTQQPFHLKSAFTFQTNQLQKCRTVERLFFVRADTGQIYEVAPSAFTYTMYTTSDGRSMVCITWLQPAVKEVGRSTEAQLKELRQLTTTTWRGYRK